MKIQSPKLTDFERLLIVKTSSIGDVIHALPVVSLLKNAHPSLQIGWVVRSKSSSVLEGNPNVDWLHVIADRTRTNDVTTIRNDLRQHDYQCALDMQGLFMSGLITFLSGAPVRIGLDRNREGNKVFLTHPIVPGQVGRKIGDRHAIDVLLGFVRALGVEDVPTDLPAQSYLGAGCIGEVCEEMADLVGPRIALNVGASTLYKQWPLGHWVELAGLLISTGCSVVFVGDGQDAKRVRQILDEMTTRGLLSASAQAKQCVDFSGRTSLGKLAAVLQNCSVAVSGDTGPMHLANAVGLPVVALFGSTNPLRTGPYGQKHVVLDMHLSCSPCYRKPTCDGRVDCMTAITPAAARNAVGSVLKVHSLKSAPSI